ncbi:hypothetical protein F5884DRAFT_529396 [Xylogone sp. PMI_703]|nr:hypothetical protein F5884DRAFT_529396 [Xylogone sp. PMI_703]
MAIPNIYAATVACRLAFEQCTGLPALMKQEWAENRLADFNLWAARVGASGKHEASLDNRLAMEQEVRGVVINLLVTLCNLVQQCVEMGEREDINQGLDPMTTEETELELVPAGDDEMDLDQDLVFRSMSPWSDASSSESRDEIVYSPTERHPPLKEAMANVETVLDQLPRLTGAIQKSGTAAQLQKADSKFDPVAHEDLRSYLKLIILSRLSDLEKWRKDTANWSSSDILLNFSFDDTQLTAIQRRLINANLRRRNRFIYAQRHSLRLAAEPDTAMTMIAEPYNEQLDSLNTQTRSFTPINALASMKGSQTPNEGSPVNPDDYTTDTTTSVTRGDIIHNSQRHDTPSRQAGTQVSATALKITYPHAPNVKDGLRSFKCPCCCQILPTMFLERSRWKRHIAEDLCPYTCPLGGCPAPNQMYVSRLYWTNHIRNNHATFKYWQCIICEGEQRFTEVDSFLEHTKNKHGSVITDDQASILEEISFYTGPRDLAECPLCSWANSQKFLDQDALLNHVAEHVHLFSLMSLPWHHSKNEDHPQDSTKKVDEWFKRWPTLEQGFEYKPISIAGQNSSQNSSTRADYNEYFDKNDYFADDSNYSSAADPDTSSVASSVYVVITAVISLLITHCSTDPPPEYALNSTAVICHPRNTYGVIQYNYAV